MGRPGPGEVTCKPEPGVVLRAVTMSQEDRGAGTEVTGVKQRLLRKEVAWQEREKCREVTNNPPPWGPVRGGVGDRKSLGWGKRCNQGNPRFPAGLGGNTTCAPSHDMC